jgi:hypothetical protein
MGFFELGTAKDMHAKAKRELARFEADVSIDHVFNFFVTAFHVADYLDERLSKKVQKESWCRLCGDACNKAKHMELDPTRGRPDPKTPKDVSLADGMSVPQVQWRIQWQDVRTRSRDI